MTPAELVVAALATWQAVEIWRHGELFADRRDAVEVWVDSPQARGLYGAVDGWLKWFVGGLLLCPFCLSVWVGWLAVLAATGHWTAQLFVGGLAASRLANLGNDLSRAWCRTPNRNPSPETGRIPADRSGDPSINAYEAGRDEQPDR